MSGQEKTPVGSEAGAAAQDKATVSAQSIEGNPGSVPKPQETLAAGETGTVVESINNDKERGAGIAPEVLEELKKNLREQIKSEITASLAEEIKSIGEDVRGDVTNDMLREIWKINWAMKEKDQRLRFSGDIRLRYEKDGFDQNNADFAQPSNPTQLMNSKLDSERFKYRVRVGVEAAVNEQVNAVIRLSTGSTSNPVSTNATIGDFMNKDSVLFDQAYVRWQPWKGLTLYGGRMPSPWFSSDLVWDNDVNFEGLAMNARTSNPESWSPFLTTGAFPLQQNDFTERGKWLLAGQTGVEKKNKKGVSTKIGVAYYNFKNVTGILNDPLSPGATDWTAPLFQQKGNTLFNISADPNSIKTAPASEFKEVNIIGTLDLGFWDPVHIILLGDYVKNIGFKKADVAERTSNPDPAKEIEGYQYGLAIGHPSTNAPGQWQMYFYKKRLEADAVLDAFTDSDFHLGGTNAKGWILGTDVGVSKNMWLALKWMSADEISGPPLAIDVLQVDLNARF